MKTTTANGFSKSEAKYQTLIADSLREFREIHKELRRCRAKSGSLRAASRRTMNETWEILRRVEATL